MNSEKICEEALAEIAEGNTNALSVIYDKMSRSIFALAYTLTCNYCDAEDVLQNTMIDIARWYLFWAAKIFIPKTSAISRYGISL